MTVKFPNASIQEEILQKNGLSNLNIPNDAIEIILKYRKSNHKEEIERFISYLLDLEAQCIPRPVSGAQL